MRMFLMCGAAMAALVTANPVPVNSASGKLIVTGLDNSDSYPLFINAAVARSAGNTVQRLVEQLKPGDRVKVLSFGLAGVATRLIDIEVEIGRKARARPRRVAGTLGAMVRSLPGRVGRGEIQVQSRTNIIGFIEAIAPSLNCEMTPTRIVLFSDGIEWSSQIKGDDLLASRVSLPSPSGMILKGCAVEMRGLGQQTAELGTDSRWFPLLRAQWTAFFKKAGAASFTAYAEFQ